MKKNKPAKINSLASVVILTLTASTGAFLFSIRRNPQPVFFSDPQCRTRYQTLYGLGPLDVRVIFGYKDARPARYVGDIYERNALVLKLLAPCREGSAENDAMACGFERSNIDMDLFTKKIPGSDGALRLVNLYVTASSTGPDDEENRADPFQLWRSQHAQKQFLSGLGVASAVFYDGHSRDGGGPDFNPPVLTKSSHPDYAWYKARHPGIKMLVQAIEHEKISSPRPCRLIGLFSCASDHLFSAKLRRANPDVEWMMSKDLIYYYDALQEASAALSDFLSMKCRPRPEEPKSQGTGA